MDVDKQTDLDENNSINEENSLNQDVSSKKRKEQSSSDSPRQRESKAKRVRGIDDEADQSGDEEEGDDDSDDGSADEEEEDDTQYVEDGFLVRDDVDSNNDDESNSDGEEDAKEIQRKKLQRLKKRRGEVQLDEEDVQLILEHQQSMKGRSETNKQNASEDKEIAPIKDRNRSNSEDSEEGDDYDQKAVRPDPMIKNRVNDNQGRESRAYYDEDDEGSDMGGFIVDEDEDDAGSHTEGTDRRRSASAVEGTRGSNQITQRRTGRREGPTYDQLQEAMDIFGAGFDDFDDEDEDEDRHGRDDSEGEGEKDGENLDSNGERNELGKKDQRRIQRLRSRYERSQLVATFCTERDDILRRVDKPERLQEVLVGRDTPHEDERRLEARWMAAKLASRMIADRHLHPRANISLTANPLVAKFSQIYDLGSDLEKEERMRTELEAPIALVLHFLQVDLWEVPFIWSYRRDYLHPLMTREHLWLIFRLEEDWDASVDTKFRLSLEIEALADAAKVVDDDGSSQNDVTHLARLEDDIRRLSVSLESAQSDLRLAEAEVQQAMDLVDEKDEPTAEDRERVATASAEAEQLQAQVQTLGEELHTAREEAKTQQSRFQRRSKFHPAAARETLRLFPADRYMAMVRDSTDDTELRDVLQFLRLLAQNTEADANTTEEQAEEHADADGRPKTILNKRAMRLRRNEYARYKSIEPLRKFVETLACPVSEFGDALRHGYRSEVPQTPEALCSEQARELLVSCKIFSSEQQVINAARIVIGTELSMEPSVRSAARAMYKRVVTVSTRPTTKGRSVITPFHEYFGLHFLQGKPLSDFYLGAERSLFIRLAEAERDGLITVSFDLPSKKITRQRTDAEGNQMNETIEVDEPDMTTFLLELKLLVNFLPTPAVKDDLYPNSRPSWDVERVMCMQACVEQYLCPSLQQEVRRELMRIGKEAIVQQAAQNFSTMLAVGPYIPPYQDVRERIKDTLRACPNRPFYGTVVSIFVSLGRNEPLCMAYVNKDGVLRAHDLIPAQALNQKDERIKRFLVENRPDLVVINASGAGAARSTAIVVEKNILKEVEEEVRRRDQARREGRMEGVAYVDDDEEFVPYRAQVMVIKDELPRIFMNSPRSKEMFSDLQPGEAAAVCLARFAQEPLAEYCCAWKIANSQEVFGYELLFLKVHPLTDLLRGAKQALLDAMKHRLVDAVCELGVDVNKACAYDHLAPMLAFVGGLGLRKADALRQNIRKGAKPITSRNELLLRKLLGSNVWTNAAGFLRICGDHVVDPLDNTRIHPECYTTYDFATKICADALEVVHSNSDYVPNVEKLMATSRRVLDKRMERHRHWLDLWENGERPIPGVTKYDEKVRTTDGKEHPLGVELNDMLSQLELDDYAAELEDSGQGKRRLLLEQIKDELRFPCLDLRLPLAPWTPAEMFTLLTNQTDQSVYVGLKVGGTVIDVSDTTMMDERSGEYRRRQRATIQTEAGLRGFISQYDAVDAPPGFSFETFEMSSVLFVGKHIEAVVIGVKKDKLQLDLAIKPSLLSKTESWWMEQRCTVRQATEWWATQGKKPEFIFDKFFMESEALRVCREEEESQQQTADAVNHQLASASLSSSRGGGSNAGAGSTGNSSRSLMRVVHHPYFANLDYKAAEERMRLEAKGAGEVLIRPSSKGPNFLTITWAFQENWFKHISVEERGKRAGDLGVGSQLFVLEDDMKEAYSDLDDLIANYIVPMNDIVSVVLKHRSFKAGTVAEVDAAMFASRAESPQKIPYFFRFEPTKPGAFVLTWLSLNIRSEQPVRSLRVEVRPNGLLVQGRTFVRPSDLIVWFKETQTSQSARQVAESAEARRAAARAAEVSAANAMYNANLAPSTGDAQPRKSRFHN